MKRREIIKLAALATGVAVSAPLISSLLSGCQADIPDEDANYVMEFFSKDEFHFVRDLVNTILPKTDSPSASEVGVHRIIDHMVGKVYEAEDQAKYKSRFAALGKYLNEGNETNTFLKLNTDKKFAMLQKLSDSEDDTMKDAQKAFLDMRQQTVAYYLSSEKIATTYLNYLPVPGKYEPCISVESMGGKAWAI